MDSLSQEWKSPWRIEFERRSAEEAAARRANRHSRPRPKARCQQPKPKREYKPRAPKRPKMKTLCSCGRRVGKPDELYCSWCRQHPCAAAGRKCAKCDAKIIRTNKSGLCRKHAHGVYRKEREIRKRGPRPVCKYQADGMRCTQRLYRDNQLGLCCFHSGRQMGSEYRKRKPKMEAIQP